MPLGSFVHELAPMFLRLDRERRGLPQRFDFWIVDVWFDRSPEEASWVGAAFGRGVVEMAEPHRLEFLHLAHPRHSPCVPV